jgi:REP element-mobilizing transposase RayT
MYYSTMPRGPRLDHSGALHHVMGRGIERCEIFRCDRDRREFLTRLGELVTAGTAALYAWALLPNHFHLLMRTGNLPLSRLMQRLLGDYADLFNARYHRCGHLFQNRFKSTLVDEDGYFLELVRYIHLNPVRAQLPVTLEQLDDYPWTGHAVLLGTREFAAQNVDAVLARFGPLVGEARTRYTKFVRDGVTEQGRRDLSGGGLRRSVGGMDLRAPLERGRERWAFDERVLGSGPFVEAVLQEAARQRQTSATDQERAIRSLTRQIIRHFQVTEAELRGRTQRRSVVAARAAFAYLLARHRGVSLSAVARHLHVSPQTAARARQRGDAVLAMRNLTPEQFLTD